MAILEDDEDVIRTHVFPAGSYYISNNHRLQVDTVFRRFSMTCRQMITRFGRENVSQGGVNAWDSGNDERGFEVIHAVMPNTRRETGRLDADRLLSESSFDEMPILVPRWDINGEDAYGSSCPGMLALGGIKALQIQQMRKDQAIDKLVNPPLIAPSSMKTERISLLHGDVN